MQCQRPITHEILKPQRVHELIERVKAITHNGSRFLVGTSYGGGKVPLANVVRASDFLLVHGNGVSDPNRIIEMGPTDARGAGLPADADPVQRGRPFRFR